MGVPSSPSYGGPDGQEARGQRLRSPLHSARWRRAPARPSGVLSGVAGHDRCGNALCRAR